MVRPVDREVCRSARQDGVDVLLEHLLVAVGPFERDGVDGLADQTTSVGDGSDNFTDQFRPTFNSGLSHLHIERRRPGTRIRTPTTALASTLTRNCPKMDCMGTPLWATIPARWSPGVAFLGTVTLNSTVICPSA